MRGAITKRELRISLREFIYRSQHNSVIITLFVICANTKVSIGFTAQKNNGKKEQNKAERRRKYRQTTGKKIKNTEKCLKVKE